MTDALSIARDLLRCPSVTPADAGAIGVLENILKGAGFEVHRVTFSEPGAADIDNLYARIGDSARTLPLPDIPTWCRRATRAHGLMARSPATSRTAFCTGAGRST